jgi:hypothetical protein
MTKYKKAFTEMLEYNQKLFNEFKTTHDNYAKNPQTWKTQFNEQGTKALRIIRRYENILCSHSENSGYGKFSTTLSDKFWTEVRNYLPLIDQVEII